MSAVSETATRFVANVIDGEERGANGESTFEKLAPATGEPMSTVARSDRADVDAAVAAALAVSERAVEKHINSVFSKLGLSEEPDVHRRVKAVLVFLQGG